MSRRFVLSTVGISIFSNILESNERTHWVGELNRHSNSATLPSELTTKLAEIKERVYARLLQGSVAERRRLSAELNGVYALYGDTLTSSGDVHYLLATDTALGKAAATVVGDFLQQQGVNASIHVPESLNTASLSRFSQGIKALLTWCEETIPGFRESGYEVIFNLTAAFKSLQGYLNIVGMFYADRIVYLFEGSSELLTIPKLPIRVDTEQLRTQADKLALLGAGATLSRAEVAALPEALLHVQTGGEVTISDWGALIWNSMKREILTAHLLDLPSLHYEPSFRRDFEKATPQQRLALQETLAQASALLHLFDGDPGSLKGHGGLQYDNYTNKRTREDRPLGHFRITQGDRVSCLAEQGSLRLRHFGAHDYVNENP